MSKLNRPQVEELLFAFQMQIATVDDFSTYINAITNKSTATHTTKYISNLKEYFRKYFLTKLKPYADKVLSSAPTILDKLNEIYSPRFVPTELLTQIKTNYCLNNETNELTLLGIKYSIEGLLTNRRYVSNTQKIPNELLFILYLISQTQIQPSPPLDKITRVLTLSQEDFPNITRFLNLSTELNLNKLDGTKIQSIFFSKISQDNQEDLTHAMLINVCECISYPLNANTFQSELQLFINKCKAVNNNINVFKDVVTFQIFLNFFECTLNDNNIYFILLNEVSQIIINDKTSELLLFQWISQKITMNDINIAFVPLNYCDIYVKYLKMCFTEKVNRYLYKTITQIFVKLATKNKNNMKLIEIYKYFLPTLNIIIESNNCMNETKMGVFYFKLLSRIYKTQVKVHKVMNTQLNAKYINHFDLFVLLMYLHSGTTQSMIDQLKSVKYISELNALYILPNVYYSDGYKDINTKLGTNAVCYKKLSKTINQQLLERKLFYKNVDNYFIYCIEVIKSDYNIINDEWFYNNKIISQTQRKNYLNQNYYYVFRALYIVNSQKNKYLYIYERLSQCWWSFQNQQWITELNIPKDTESLVLVYFKRKNPEITHFNVFNIYSYDSAPITELSWNLLYDIIQINPYIVQSHLDIFDKVYSLNNISNIEKLYSFIREQRLQTQDQIKRLLYDIVTKNKHHFIKSHNKQAVSVVIEIEKNSLYIEPYILLEKTNTYFSTKNEQLTSNNNEQSLMIWNYIYYLNNINSIRHIPKQLVVCITFIYFLSKIPDKKIKDFWLIKLNEITIMSQYNTKQLSSFIETFPPETNISNIFKNVFTYWENVHIIKHCDYIWKYLSSLFILLDDLKFFVADIDYDTVCNKMERFMKLNKVLFRGKNVNDNNVTICFTLLFDVLKTKFENHKHLFQILIKNCFDITFDDDSYQLSDFQKMIFKDYIWECLRVESLHNNNKSILKLFKFIIKFLDNYDEQLLFAKCLLQMKERNDISFYKSIKPLLVTIYKDNYKRKYNEFHFVIVYYLTYCKINFHKQQITQICKLTSIPDIDEHNIKTFEIIFPCINKHIQKKLELNKTDNVNVNYQQNVKNIAKIKEYVSHINEDTFNRKSEILFPLDFVNKPFILYVSREQNANIENEIVYAKGKYELMGIIYTDNEGKISVFVKNKINLYWYSINEDYWYWKMDLFKTKYNGNNMMLVYFLIEDDNNENKICFRNFRLEKQGKFVLSLENELMWMVNNNLSELLTNFGLFYVIFGFEENSIIEKFISISELWKEEFTEFRQFVFDFIADNKRNCKND